MSIGLHNIKTQYQNVYLYKLPYRLKLVKFILYEKYLKSIVLGIQSTFSVHIFHLCLFCNALLAVLMYSSFDM